MSRDGPPASSFTEPRLTGFLTKQGGQGIMSANWRKRYFVLDNHYLFYYKNKQDRKPVGVVCLSDYKSCHKASVKESRKSKFTFVIEKGEHTEQELGYPIRNYYIYAENEGEMNAWIESISREIASIDDFTKKGPKVDIKAFDELSTTVEGGTKLSHPTAARPKPQGRRPPRKYIPYNEEEDGSSPRVQKRPASDTTLEDFPNSLISNKSPLVEAQEDTSLKKGHHPTVAMLPKQMSTDSQVPPEEPTSSHEQLPPDPLHKETPAPVSKPSPIPPPTSAKPKQRTSIKELSPPAVANGEENTIKSPEKKIELGSKTQEKPPPTSVRPAPPPPTKPKSKRSVADVPKDISDNSAAQEELNTLTEHQVPTDSTNSISSNNKFSKPNPPRKVKQLVVEPSDNTNTSSGNTKPIPKPRTRSNTSKDNEKRQSIEESTTTNSSDIGSPVDESMDSLGGQNSADDTENSLQEIGANLKEIKDFIRDEKEAPITQGSEPNTGNQNPTVKTIGYENVMINLKQDGQLTISAPEGVKEDVEQEIKQKEETKTQPEMTLPVITTPPSNDISTTTPISKGLSPVRSLEDPANTRSGPVPIETSSDSVKDGLYDVPSPNKVTIRQTPEEEDGYDIPKLLLRTDTPTRPQVQVSSMDSSDYDLPTTFGTTGQTTPSNSILSDDSLPKDHLSPERDAWGYAVINKKRNQPSSTESSSNTNGVPPSLAADTLAAHVQIPEDIASIPMNLQKAKEILRLAMIVKAEVLEMRQEVESELAIARRERHDSQLMKQNAAEILKMAKDVLQRVQSS